MSRAVILLCLCALSLATPPDADIIRSELAADREVWVTFEGSDKEFRVQAIGQTTIRVETYLGLWLRPLRLVESMRLEPVAVEDPNEPAGVDMDRERWNKDAWLTWITKKVIVCVYDPNTITAEPNRVIATVTVPVEWPSYYNPAFCGAYAVDVPLWIEGRMYPVVVYFEVKRFGFPELVRAMNEKAKRKDRR